MEVSLPSTPSAICQDDAATSRQDGNIEGPNDSRVTSGFPDIMIGPSTSTPIKRDDNLSLPPLVDALSESMQRQLLSEMMRLTQQQRLPSNTMKNPQANSTYRILLRVSERGHAYNPKGTN